MGGRYCRVAPCAYIARALRERKAVRTSSTPGAGRILKPYTSLILSSQAVFFPQVQVRKNLEHLECRMQPRVPGQASPPPFSGDGPARVIASQASHHTTEPSPITLQALKHYTCLTLDIFGRGVAAPTPGAHLQATHYLFRIVLVRFVFGPPGGVCGLRLGCDLRGCQRRRGRLWRGRAVPVGSRGGAVSESCRRGCRVCGVAYRGNPIRVATPYC